jgi:hypothetical protein
MFWLENRGYENSESLISSQYICQVHISNSHGKSCDQSSSFLPRIVDSFSLNDIKILSTISPIISISDLVIDPVIYDLKLSIPKIKAMPDTCPISSSIPFEVPSDAG